MKIKFTETAYDLATRELVDARLTLTFAKGDHSIGFIESEIRNSRSISILNDDGDVIVDYVGFSDMMVIREYETGFCNVELFNNFLLAQTMQLADRVDTLEKTSQETQDKTSELDGRAADLEDRADGFNDSQNNQDVIIADIMDEMMDEM